MSSQAVAAMDRRIRIAVVVALLAVGVTLFAWGETMMQAAAAANQRILSRCTFSCPPLTAPNPVYEQAELLGVAMMVAAILLGALVIFRAARRKTAIPA